MSARRGILLVVGLIGIAVAISIGALIVASAVGGSTPTIPENATLRLHLGAPLSEIEPVEVLSELFSRPPTLRATVGAIRKAKTDTRIKSIVFEPDTSGSLWAQLQELRAALEDFKRSGKPLTAYLEAGGAGDLYLASAANHVVMMPAGELDVSGLASYEVFFRGALDKLGVFPDLLHIGDYKTAANTFTQKGFTPAHREMTQSLNHDWYEELVRAVAQGRHLSDAAARQAVDGGPYLAAAAQKAGLVDELAYADQLDAEAPVQGTSRVEGQDYLRTPVASDLPGSGGTIALLYAVGTIASGKSSFDAPTDGVLGSDTFTQWLRKVRIDPAVRAVVVRIDSPGGSAIASEVIWREMMLTRDVKPLIVSMGDVAASGGYYIAAPAHTIVAEPGTLTGSIGVVTGKFVLQGALDKLGIGTAAATNGPMAAINSPFQPFSKEERARVEQQMHETYELFLKRVADGRHEDVSKVDAVAQGRVWTGRQAREIGLVDELGGLDDAIKLAKARAKLDPQKGVDLLVYPPKRSFFDLFSSSLGGSSTSASANLASSLAGSLLGSRDARAVQAAASVLQRFRRGEPLTIMPNVFVN